MTTEQLISLGICQMVAVLTDELIKEPGTTTYANNEEIVDLRDLAITLAVFDGETTIN